MEIYNEPSEEEVKAALAGTLNEQWELISTLNGDKEFEEKKELIKNGIYHDFNIEKVVRGYYEEYPDSNNIKIRGYSKFDLYEFWTEVRQRQKIMKDLLRELISPLLEQQDEWSDEDED